MTEFNESHKGEDTESRQTPGVPGGVSAERRASGQTSQDEGFASAHMLGCEISTDPLDPLQPILRMCQSHHPDEEMEILERAYRGAVVQPCTQRR